MQESFKMEFRVRDSASEAELIIEVSKNDECIQNERIGLKSRLFKFLGSVVIGIIASLLASAIIATL